MVGSDLGAVFGRRTCLSVKGMNAATRAKLLRMGSRAGRRISTDNWEAAEPEQSAAEAQEELVGTALVLAFLQATSLLPVVDIARKKTEAAQHFAALRTPAGTDFDGLFGEMLVLHSALKPAAWLIRARLFRCILSQRPDGRWEASDSLALALLSRPAAEVASAPAPSLLARAIAATGGEGALFPPAPAREAPAQGKLTSGVARPPSIRLEAADDARGSAARAPALFRLAAAAGGGTVVYNPTFAEDAAGDGCANGGGCGDGGGCNGCDSDDHAPPVPSSPDDRRSDCPLMGCTRAALLEPMPPRLAALPPPAAPADVWATLCCLAWLERIPLSWLTSDAEDADSASERTLVDDAHAWLASHAARHPALAPLLADGSLQAAATEAVRGWERAWNVRVAALRRCPAILSQRARSHLERSASDVYTALREKHELFSTFLSEPLDGLRRWQRFMIVLTLILSTLLVNIWMFYSKSKNCCAQLRELLDSGPDGGACPADATQPCRGFVGTCADLRAQFADVPVMPSFPAGLSTYVCTAFPDTASPLSTPGAGGASLGVPLRDALIVGCISAAVALPVAVLLRSVFEAANDAGAPKAWLSWTSLPLRMIFGFASFNSWRYAGPAPPRRLLRWYARFGRADALVETLACCLEQCVAWLVRSPPSWEATAPLRFDPDAAAAVGCDVDDVGAEISARACRAPPDEEGPNTPQPRASGSPGPPARRAAVGRPATRAQQLAAAVEAAEAEARRGAHPLKPDPARRRRAPPAVSAAAAAAAARRRKAMLAGFGIGCVYLIWAGARLL